MRVTLLGTGDTTGTPTAGCTCATCAAARERDVSFSVHVANERTGESLLVDFSPDFRRQFLDHDVALPDAGLVTHIHFDHLDGLGNVYRLVDGLPVHAPNETDPATNESVAETIRRKYDYLGDRISVQAHPVRDVRITGAVRPRRSPTAPVFRTRRRRPRDGREALAHRRHELRRSRPVADGTRRRRPPLGGRDRPGVGVCDPSDRGASRDRRRRPPHVRYETHDAGGRTRPRCRARRRPSSTSRTTTRPTRPSRSRSRSTARRTSCDQRSGS